MSIYPFNLLKASVFFCIILTTDNIFHIYGRQNAAPTKMVDICYCELVYIVDYYAV